jgi:hypothetical protein
MRPVRSPLPRAFVFVVFVLAGVCGARVGAAQAYLGAPVVVPTATAPVAVYTADVNGDGIPDLIYIDAGATATASTTHVLLGDGKGGFTQSAVLATAGDSIGIGNLLGTGKVDIAWLSTNATSSLVASVAPGAGDGTFLPVQSSVLSGGPASGQPARYGYLTTTKLLYQARTGTGVSVLLAEDVANNQLDAIVLEPSHGEVDVHQLAGFVGPLAIAPLNMTGLAGVITQNGAALQAEIVSGPAAQSIALDTNDSLFSGTNGVLSVVIDDFNGDGLADLAVTGMSGQIQIFPGNGDGTFSTSSIGGTSSPNSTQGDGGHLVAAADVNGDGIPDLLTYTPLGVSVELGSANGNYTLQGVYPAGTATANSFVTADFNGDGATDVALNGPTGIVILYGKAASTSGCAGGATQAQDTVVACPEPSAFEGAFTLSAVPPGGAGAVGMVGFAISPQASTGTPTTTLGSATVVNGVATLSVAGLPLTSSSGQPAAIVPGNYTVTATYVAQNSNVAVQIPGMHTILQGPTSIVLTPTTPATVYYGQQVNGTFAVSVVDGAKYPATGTWTLLDNGVAVPSCTDIPLTSPCPYGSPELLNAGPHSFSLTYNGDVYNAPSTSTSYLYTVLPDITTVSSLTSSANPAVQDAPVTFTVTLAGNAATPAGGTVQFYADGNPLGTAQTVNANGQASITTSTLAPGTHAITVTYSGTQNFLPVSGGSLQQVITNQTLAALVVVQSSLNPSDVGQAVTFSSTLYVTAAFQVQVQSGTMTFLDGTNVLGTGTINAQGVATLTTSTLTQGTHAISASYPGGVVVTGTQTYGILPSVSNPLTQVVGPALPSGFTLTVTPTPVTVPAGQDAILLAAVTETGGFSQAVTLSCSGLPTEAACDFVTPTLAAGGGSTTLDITTHAPHSCSGPYVPYVKNGAGNQARVSVPACGAARGGSRVSAQKMRGVEVGGPMLAGLLLLLPRRRWWKRRGLLVLVALLAGVMGLNGCGGNCTDLGTRPGNYTVTVIATASGGMVESQKVVMEVWVP